METKTRMGGNTSCSKDGTDAWTCEKSKKGGYTGNPGNTTCKTVNGNRVCTGGNTTCELDEDAIMKCTGAYEGTPDNTTCTTEKAGRDKKWRDAILKYVSDQDGIIAKTFTLDNPDDLANIDFTCPISQRSFKQLTKRNT